VLIAWGGITVVLFAWHAHVAGGIGGYGPLSPFTDLDARVDELVQILLWPFRNYLQTYLKAWLIELGLVLFVAGLPILLIHRRAAATLAVGWVWLILSGVFQLTSESTAPWRMYVTIAAFGLMLGRSARRRRRFVVRSEQPRRGCSIQVPRGFADCTSRAQRHCCCMALGRSGGTCCGRCLRGGPGGIWSSGCSRFGPAHAVPRVARRCARGAGLPHGDSPVCRRRSTR
jgi:hypothetical protein